MIITTCLAIAVKVMIATQTAKVTCADNSTRSIPVITGNPAAVKRINRTPVGTYRVSEVLPIDPKEGYMSGAAIFAYANDATKDKPASFYAAHGLVPGGSKWSIGCIRGNWLQSGIRFQIGTVFTIR